METNGMKTSEVLPAPGNGVVVEDADSEPEPSMTSLVGGIIADAARLIEQQLAMFRQDMRDDLRKARDAVFPFAAGIVVTLAATFLVVLMFPLLLQWSLPELPLWACFGIVVGVLALVGGVLIFAGVKKFGSFHLLSDKSIKVLKENLQWTTNPK